MIDKEAQIRILEVLALKKAISRKKAALKDLEESLGEVEHEVANMVKDGEIPEQFILRDTSHRPALVKLDAYSYTDEELMQLRMEIEPAEEQMEMEAVNDATEPLYNETWPDLLEKYL